MRRTLVGTILLVLAIVAGGVGMRYLPDLQMLFAHRSADIDDLDVQLRLRQAAEASTAVGQKVDQLQKALDAEKKRVVSSDVDRELNQDTIARLTKDLATAKDDLGKRHAELVAAKAAQESVITSERRKQEAASPLSPPSKPDVAVSRGVKTWPNGLRCEGDMQNGQMNGAATCRFANGNVYQGQMRGDLRDGPGVLTYADGTRLEAAWREDKVNGRGTMSFANGNRLEAEWRDGKVNGYGVMSYANDARFDGQWVNDKPNGPGTLVVPGQAAFSGTWRDGCLWGGRDWVTVATSRQACGRP